MRRPTRSGRWTSVHDVLASGRSIRVLNVIDAYTRESLAMEVDTSFAGLRVTRVLNEIIAEMLRLKRAGVHFDYYMMDAFWFAPDGGYRTWRKPNWPNGPDAWIAKCKANGVQPPGKRTSPWLSDWPPASVAIASALPPLPRWSAS